MDETSNVEQWRLIEGINNPPGITYEVSSLGRVRSTNEIKNEIRLLKFFTTSKGYQMVGLGASPNRLNYRVHRLVCAAFHGAAPSSESVVRHLNAIRSDNRPSNLMWGTPKENSADMVAHGNSLRGERHGNAKLTEDDVRALRDLFFKKVKRTEIAARFGLNRRSVYCIADGKSWGHI